MTEIILDEEFTFTDEDWLKGMLAWLRDPESDPLTVVTVECAYEVSIP